jgi:hypothetical protein
MIRRPLYLALLCLPLLHACSSPSDPIEIHNPVLSVPADYATLQLAADAAQAGDRIVVSYREAPYRGDVLLPAGVTLMGHTGNVLIPVIEGQVSAVGGDDEAKIEDLKIVNDEGPGLVIQDSAIDLNRLWILDCDGAGIELRGDSPCHITGLDIEGCDPAILITGVTLTGHHDNVDHPAAFIGSCNFLGNGEPGALHNITFADIPVSYTVYVDWNYWGAGVVVPDDSIHDFKDDSQIKGVADTEHEDFQRWPNPITNRWWN